MNKLLALGLLALAFSSSADSGLGVQSGPLLSVMAATGAGPQALVLVDAAERRISVYTLDAQGRIVFTALRPYLYDLSIPDEYPHPDFPIAPGGWREIRRSLIEHHRKDFNAFKGQNKGAHFDDYLRSFLKNGAEQTQLMTASDAAANQPQLIQVLDRSNQKLLVYRFTSQAGLEFLAERSLAFDRKAPDLTGKPGYLPVEAVRRAVEKHPELEEP